MENQDNAPQEETPATDEVVDMDKKDIEEVDENIAEDDDDDDDNYIPDDESVENETEELPSEEKKDE